MKEIIKLIIVLTMFSCNAQEKEVEITGNWVIEANKGLDKFTYSEVFINDKTINIYDDFIGYKPPYYYVKENNTLYIIINGEKNKYSNIKMINNNCMSFELEDGNVIIYKKIISDGMKLEDLLSKYDSNASTEDRNLLSDKYWKAFNKRKIEWEKTYNKD